MTIRVHRLTCAAFFSSTHLYMRTKEHLVHACQKNAPASIFEQEVLCVHAELNAVEIACIMCARITPHHFH